MIIFKSGEMFGNLNKNKVNKYTIRKGGKGWELVDSLAKKKYKWEISLRKEKDPTEEKYRVK